MSSRKSKKSASKKQPVWLYGLLAMVGIGIIVLAVSAFSSPNTTVAFPLEISVSQAVEKRSAPGTSGSAPPVPYTRCNFGSTWPAFHQVK